MGKITDKKIVFILAPNDFRDEEYFQPKVIIQSQGGEVFTAVIGNPEEVTGTQGGKARPDIDFDKLVAEDFDAVVFVGGVGAKVYLDNKYIHKLINSFVDESKVVAAICIAPSILANAGILNNVEVTSSEDQEENIRSNGGIWTGKGVQISNNIVTANGPDSALNFGIAIADALSQ